MSTRAWWRLMVITGLYGGLLLATATVGGLAYFHFGDPRNTCASCHEMTSVHSNWSASPHRTIHCRSCHGGSLTLDVHALESHLDRLVKHFSGDPTRPARLKEKHVGDLNDSCRACHPQAFADWQGSRHATTYSRIFLDDAHNRSEPPSNDCLRCHGMFFQGDITTLVARFGTAGSWSLVDPAKAGQPAIPCLACHQIHAPAGASQVASFFDHREGTHFAANLLPVATIFQGERPVQVSRDPRQRICLQCHAPAATHQLATADDHTPAGVHEGLSCRDCHWSHTESARASCSACHPADSHCKLPVETMDTSFLSLSSKHNIHTVSCQDCHPLGRPTGQRRQGPLLSTDLPRALSAN